MIDFRYHIVSIVAVFLALALGLFLGSTTLQGHVLTGISGQVKNVTADNHKLKNQISTKNNQIGTDQRFLEALQPLALFERLEGQQTVAVISAPGVDSGVVDGVIKSLSDADATVTARVQLDANFIDPTQDALLGSLAKDSKPSGFTLPAASGAVQAAAELADVLSTKPGQPLIPENKVQGVLEAYAGGKVLSVSGGLADVRPASLTVFVVPAPNSLPAADRTASDALFVAMGNDFAQDSSGTVLAEPSTASTDGALQAVQSSSVRPTNLTTVDSADTTEGQIAVVFGLVAALDGHGGDFGPGQKPQLPSVSSPP